MENFLLNLPLEVAQRLYSEYLLTVQNPGRLYGQQDAVLTVPPPQEEQPAPQTEQVYRGEVETSKKGSHPVLIYDIPQSQRCYVFQWHKKSTREDTNIYRCSGCKQQIGKYTSIFVKGGNLFTSDPCTLSHNCLPMDRHKDKADRVGYKSCQRLRQDKTAYKTPTRRHYSSAAQSIVEMPWKDENERRKVLSKFVGKSYQERRRTFAKASAAQKRRVEMDDVLEDLARLPDGDNFLHVQRRDLHIYYSEEVITKAVENGLYALIGDGVHKLNPITIPERMDKGQLYIIHGVISGGFEVPLLYAITRHKNLETYRTIFGRLKDVIGAGTGLRIVLDFEKAAIRAARETFTEAQVEGCAFHLAQAWNRMAKELGLARFIKGSKRLRVDMWCKWEVEELRTTNAAEAFHSKLRQVLSRRTNPPFEELLVCLKDENTLALGRIMHVHENPRATKLLRSRDLRRRLKIFRP